MRDKLEHLERKRGKRPAELDQDPPPEAALDAWDHWHDLHAGRTYNGMAITPLSWLDIDAWCRIRGLTPTFTELELIRTIDRAFCEVQSKRGE